LYEKIAYTTATQALHVKTLLQEYTIHVHKKQEHLAIFMFTCPPPSHSGKAFKKWLSFFAFAEAKIHNLIAIKGEITI